MTCVKVELGKRSYNIQIGEKLLPNVGALIQPVFTGRQIFVVADEVALKLHGPALLSGLKGFKVHILPITSGEGAKSLSVYNESLIKILAQSPERGDLVIAFGGGVTGDLAGFLASTVLRGLNLVQVPTTLLSQVDSSVGGKTGINAPQGKNLIGAFYQPSLVIADLTTLETLPAREIRAGYAEILKYALIDDAGFFDWLETNASSLLGLNSITLNEAVSRSCQAKARIVAEDEREIGKRALLNFGHTFAHAFEAAGNYDGTILHGEAVSVGMIAAFDLSHRLGLVHGQDVLRVKKHIAKQGLPTSLTEFSQIEFKLEDMLKVMSRDKKVIGGAVRFILSKGIGKAFFSEGANPAEVKATLQHLLEK